MGIYPPPVLSVEYFDKADIITTSLGVGEDGDTGYGELQ